MTTSCGRFADERVDVTEAAQGLDRAVGEGFGVEGAGVVLVDGEPYTSRPRIDQWSVTIVFRTDDHSASHRLQDLG
jgi:hypothetical protein